MVGSAACSSSSSPNTSKDFERLRRGGGGARERDFRDLRGEEDVEDDDVLWRRLLEW